MYIHICRETWEYHGVLEKVVNNYGSQEGQQDFDLYSELYSIDITEPLSTSELNNGLM